MCNRYETPQQMDFEEFRVAPPTKAYKPAIGPRQDGPFIVDGRAVVGQWGMIEPGSPVRAPKAADGRIKATNNARWESVRRLPTFRDSWAQDRRCLIPARSFDEPYWGTGKNIWWRFRRTDGAPWAVAGLWSEWVDPESGEVVPNYTMITRNCDDHPLLGLMHKPEPGKPADKQDKRTVVLLQPEDRQTWLTGSKEAAADLVAKLLPVEAFAHGAVDPAQQVHLPIATA